MATRNIFIAAFALAAVLGAVQNGAAQDYPSRPVRILVGFPPGGATDIVTRLLGKWLSDRLGQPFVIENRPGAATNIATEAAVRASADGYTLVTISSTNTINATLYDKLNFNFIRDIAPVAAFVRIPIVMEVNSSFPAQTFPEFIAHVEANPGKITLGSPGNGTPAQISGELFKSMIGADLVTVPYRGSTPMLTDLLGGQIQAALDAVPTQSLEYIRAGKLRALAVTGATRLEVLPGIPTLGEFVPGFEASYWLGLGAPKNTPSAIIDKLHAAIGAALIDPKMKARFVELGATPLVLSPAEFMKLIADDTDKWAKVIRTADIKPE